MSSVKDKYRGFKENSIFRLAVGIMLTVCGVAIGVYLGVAAVHRVPASEIIPGAGREPDAEKLRQAGIYLEFDEGESFPIDEAVFQDSTETTFRNIATDRPLALIFIDPECDHCLVLLKYWNKVVEKLLLPEVVVAVCVDTSVIQMPKEYREVIADKLMIRYSVSHFQSKYHLDFYPTVVTVDSRGIVRAIQFGLGRRLREDLLETICIL